MAGLPEFAEIPGWDLTTYVAYHESGHAVARFVNGLTIKYVTIESSEPGGIERGGHVVPAWIGDLSRVPIYYTRGLRRWKKPVFRELEFICAGSAAEALKYPTLDDFGRKPYIVSKGKESDFEIAKDLAWRLGHVESGLSEPSEEAVMGIIGEALGSVRAKLERAENWIQVMALADALTERRTLPGRVAKAVCEQFRCDFLARKAATK
jgi:hypothetical protein